MAEASEKAAEPAPATAAAEAAGVADSCVLIQQVCVLVYIHIFRYVFLFLE